MNFLMKATGKRLLSILMVIAMIMSGWGGVPSVYADYSANLVTVAEWNMTADTKMSASIPATGGKNQQNAFFF